jgi:fermentation-respiration switch protein FrsA (DUF1100 family)
LNRLIKRMLTWLRMAIIAVAATLLLWTIVLMIFEEKFIFFPEKYPRGAYEQARSIPNLRECWVTTEDGVKLHGWFAPAESARATLILSHGNGGNISHQYLLMRSLLRHKFNVLMYDYRGYGKSEGTPTETGIYMDSRAFYDYAVSLPEVDSQRIIVWGTSLGGAVAIDLATQRHAAGLILESTFTSAGDEARVIYPYFPVAPFLRNKFNSVDKIRRLTLPIFIMHGSHDTIVPLRLGRDLFAAANEPKEFFEIAGADHNDTFFVGGEEYFKRIDQFAAKAISAIPSVQ